MSQDERDNITPAADLPSFKSLHQVLQHLKEAGYKVGKSKLYEDAKKGSIRVGPDGSVLETEVRAYAGTLGRVVADIQDLNDIHNRKASKDVELTEIKIKRAQFELDRELGKYLPRKDFEQELAARAAIFETGIKHQFNVHVSEWIAVVGGHPEKGPDLLDRLTKALESELSRYATTTSFQVMFLDQADGLEEEQL